MNNRTKLLYAKLIILIVCLIIILKLFTLILAKYESETTADTEIDIAFYLFKEDYKTMTLNLGTIKPQNNAYTFDFNIGNQDGTDAAEIDLTYDLTIRTTTNLPLTYSLYMNEEYTDTGATSVIKSNDVSQDEYGTYFRTMTTDTQELLFRTPKTNSYQLVVNFPLSNNDPNNPISYNVEKYQDIIEAIEIRVESRQYTSPVEEYVQDGLRICYDGINNTGNGHSDTATSWKDLSENGNDANIVSSNSLTWNKDNLETNKLETILTPWKFQSSYTLSVLVSPQALFNYNTIWDNTLSADDNECWIYGNSVICARSKSSANILSNSTSTGLLAQVGKKYHITVVIDNENLTAKAFCNGEKIATKQGSNFIKLNGGNLTFNGYSNTKGKNKYYKMMVYDRALTDAEVMQNYDQDRIRFEF